MNLGLEEYITLDLGSGKAYLREDKAEDLRKIDSIIFDCDGVLIDIRRSYDKAIAKTVAYIFEGLTSYTIPENMVSDKIMFLFRRSGGFNNDWDIVYGITMFLICELPRSMLKKIEESIKSSIKEKDLLKRLSSIKEKMRLENFDLGSPLKNLIAKLEHFTKFLDVSGVASVDRTILKSRKVSESFYNLLKNFLYGSERVGESIIPTIFEEIFCGPTLFKEIYDVEPTFYHGPGMIENGKPIVSHESFKRLEKVLGGAKFGIASGSRFKSAQHVLRDLLTWFKPEAIVFLDDIEKAQKEYLKRGIKVNLKKPNPFSLLKSAKALEPFNLALYVGDSMEDAITVEEARKVDSRFMFAGVYEYSSMKDEFIKEFINYGCDLILPSVNDIWVVINAFRGEKP